jgi:hypothetical protein
MPALDSLNSGIIVAHNAVQEYLEENVHQVSVDVEHEDETLLIKDTDWRERMGVEPTWDTRRAPHWF